MTAVVTMPLSGPGSALAWPAKLPTDVLACEFDMTAWLALTGDSLLNVTITTNAANLALSSVSFNAHQAFVTLSGGTPGLIHNVAFSCVTFYKQVFTQIVTILVEAEGISPGADLSAATSTTTGTTTPRTLASRDADFVNVKDYGAKLNGTTDDSAAVQAAYNACPTQGTILVPSGAWKVNTPITTTAGKTVFWQLQADTSGGGNLNYITDGDSVQWYPGRVAIWKTTTTSGNIFANVDFSFTLQQSGLPNGNVSSNFRPYMKTGTNIGGAFPWNVNAVTDVYAVTQTGYTAPQAVGISSFITRYTGSNVPVWSYLANTHDNTGLPSSQTAGMNGIEMDMVATGPDDAPNPAMAGGTGNRKQIYLSTGDYANIINGEFATNIWFQTTAQSLSYSLMSVVVGSPVYIGLDTRGAVLPSGYTNPFYALLMKGGQAIEFNAPSGTWTPTPNRTLSYNGVQFVYQVNGATAALITDTGIVRIGASQADWMQFEGSTSGSNAAHIRLGGSDTNIDLIVNTQGTGKFRVVSSNGEFFHADDGGAGTVNYVKTVGSATGVPVSVSANGTDTNVALQLTGKGTGSAVVGTGASLATTAAGPFLVIPMMAGAPTGVPTNSTLGVAMVYDTTDNKLWVYNGSWKSATFA